MSDEGVTQTPTVFSSKERAALVAKALSEAARRARFSTKRRRAMSAGSIRARRGEHVLRLLRIWSFVGIFVVPCLLFLAYVSLIASHQYEAESRFTLREGMPSAGQTSSGGGGGSLTDAPADLIIQDTQVLMNYMQSRALIDTLQSRIDFRSLYDKPEVDYFSRLSPSIELFSKHKPNPTVEKVVDYWNRRTDIELQMPAGIVVFKVRAFSPDDAIRVANATIKATDDMVNKMNDSMLHDSVRLAEAEVNRSQTSLVKAKSDLEKARNEQGTLSASAASTALTALMTQVQGQLLTLQQSYETQRKFVRASAPQLKSLQAKIDAARDEIAKIQSQMTVTGRSQNDQTTKVLSGAMSKLEYASLENTVAEQIYGVALATLEQARLVSETKMMYVNTFVLPAKPEDWKYPKIPLSFGIVFASCLAGWGAIYGVLLIIRNNLI